MFWQILMLWTNFPFWKWPNVSSHLVTLTIWALSLLNQAMGSWQSGHFRYQRSAVQIQSSGKYLLLTVKKTKIMKRGREWPILVNLRCPTIQSTLVRLHQTLYWAIWAPPSYLWKDVSHYQCDQIGRFIGLWANF